MELPKDITFGDKYGPAMKITDPEKAGAYFELLVEHCMSWDKTRERAESIERENLGYWAGYYDDGTRRRVEQLFNCAHPVFGAISQVSPPTPEQAFQMGMDSVEAKD